MELYILLSHSGSKLSNIIQFFTRDEYTHCAISFDGNFDKMYCIGNNNQNNILAGGGLQIESINSEFYKTHKANIMVISMEITEEQKSKLLEVIKSYEQRDIKYNFVGLIPSFFGIRVHRKKHLYCSEFMIQVLNEAGIVDPNFLSDNECVRPNDFRILIDGKGVRKLYKGPREYFVETHYPKPCKHKAFCDGIAHNIKTKNNPRIKTKSPYVNYKDIVKRIDDR